MQVVHQKVDRTALRVTGKALVAVASWIYHEVAIVPVLVEWAEGGIPHARLSQWQKVTHHVYYACAFADAVNRFLT